MKRFYLMSGRKVSIFSHSGILFGRNPAVLAVSGHGFTPAEHFARQKHAGMTFPARHYLDLFF